MDENNLFHSVKINRDRCIGCVACMKVCPTRAIRVLKDRKANIMYERCIDCGECLRVCPHEAVVPITTPKSDLEKFKYKVTLPAPVFYSQFGQNIMPDEMQAALMEVGFDQVADETLMCEMTSRVIKEYLNEHPRPRPIISSACPVVVRLIQRLFPGLCDLILPIEPPREIASKNLREEIAGEKGLSPHDIGIFHITPCAAKMVSINYPASMEKSFLDGALSIREIYNTVMGKLKNAGLPPMRETQAQVSGIGIGWALPGGEVRSLKYHTVAVSGVHDTIKILQDVEAGKLKNIDYLECMICPDGCLGGPLTVENRFIAKSNILMLVRRLSDKKMVDAFKVKRLYKEGFFSFVHRVEPKPFPPLDPDREQALIKLEQKEELKSALPGKNCGICGAPDCATFAEDIVRGKTNREECPFFQEGGKP